ncbi:MAG TPA: glycosyltransferase family 39 protein [Thermoguttaceae bacterium]|nr:glycosyltransferase family 39 protein [Thermoguttaceae bacterium]
MGSSAWKQLALLLTLALAVRLAAGAYWQSRIDGRFGFGDSESYWTLGRAIARGEPYEFGEPNARVFRTPGYPLLLAMIFAIFGDDPSVMWARAQSAVLGMLAVAAVWWLARELFDGRTGLIAAAIAAFYPGAVAMSALVLSEAPFCVLMLVQLALGTAAWKAEKRGRAVGLAVVAGIVAGAATLVRPSWLWFTPLAAAVAVLARRSGEPQGSSEPQGLSLRPPTRGDKPRGSRGSLGSLGSLGCGGGGRWRRAEMGAAMLVGLIVAMTPWWIRNAQVTGRFVPTTLQVGASLYDGLNPQATGASDMAFVPQFVEEFRRQPAETDDPFEYRLDRRFRREAWAWAGANPARATQLGGVKLVRMWNIWPNEPAFSSWPVRLAVFFTYVPILVFGIIGAARTIRSGWPYLLCWLPAVYFTALHVVFVSSIRYRQPAMLGLIVLAAGVIGTRKKTAKRQ